MAKRHRFSDLRAQRGTQKKRLWNNGQKRGNCEIEWKAVEKQQ